MIGGLLGTDQDKGHGRHSIHRHSAKTNWYVLQQLDSHGRRLVPVMHPIPAVMAMGLQ